jgi:hypothetical protein
MRCEPFIATVRTKRFRIVGNDFFAEDFSKLRSELHTNEGRAAEL